jgi:geranyl-CoA carboxylase alpha subunit
LQDWSSHGRGHAHYRYLERDEVFDAVVTPRGGGRYQVQVGSRGFELVVAARDGATATLSVDGRRVSAGYLAQPPGTLHLALGRRTLVLRNELAQAGLPEERAVGGRVHAVMHGVLLEVFVQPGDRVVPGTRLAILEAMKMQHELRADVAGEVTLVAARAGAQVAADDLLVEIAVEAVAG